MPVPASYDNTNDGDRVAEEVCSVSGNYQDFSTTVKFSVDNIKERFYEEKRIVVPSHKFKINDETFQMVLIIQKYNPTESWRDERWLGVYFQKTDDSGGSPESTVSLKVEFLDFEWRPLEYNKEVLKKGNYWGWPKVMNKAYIDAHPGNTLNLFCTVTLHIKEEDIVCIRRTKDSVKVIEEKVANSKKERVGLPTAKEKLFTDFVIESVDGLVAVNCHRVFLASHSSVFKAMLESDMTEAKEGRLKLDFCGEVLQHLVDFLYDTTLDKNIVLDHYEDFLNLAEKYDIGHLKLQTEEVLIKNLSTDLMAQYYVLGDLYNAGNLKEAARTFMINNKDYFKDKVFMEQLKMLSPERIVEIMSIIV